MTRISTCIHASIPDGTGSRTRSSTQSAASSQQEANNACVELGTSWALCYFLRLHVNNGRRAAPCVCLAVSSQRGPCRRLCGQPWNLVCCEQPKLVDGLTVRTPYFGAFLIPDIAAVLAAEARGGKGGQKDRDREQAGGGHAMGKESGEKRGAARASGMAWEKEAGNVQAHTEYIHRVFCEWCIPNLWYLRLLSL